MKTEKIFTNEMKNKDIFIDYLYDLIYEEKLYKRIKLKDKIINLFCKTEKLNK